jgi:DNA-binding transcriptional LysR family regulator
LDKDVIAVRLTPDMEMMAVAAPDYLARHGEPQTPGDLHRHACINWRFPDGNVYRWEFEKDGAAFEMKVAGPLIANHQEVRLQGARVKSACWRPAVWRACRSTGVRALQFSPPATS